METSFFVSLKGYSLLQFDRAVMIKPALLFKGLSVDILQHMLAKLNLEDLPALAQTSRSLREAVLAYVNMRRWDVSGGLEKLKIPCVSAR